MNNSPELEKRISAIEERNRRVEADKAWEISSTRMICISLLTYSIALAFLIITGLPKPFLNAFIPAIGFALSLQTIPIIKHWWLRRKRA